MRLIFHYLRKHLGIFLLSTLFLTMEAMADLLQPTYMSYIVDEGIAGQNMGQILRYGLIMLGIAMTGALSAIMRNHFSVRTSQNVGKELRSDMYHSVQQLSLENIDHLQPASIITRITNDVTQIQDFINSLMRMMVKSPITCAGAIFLIVTRTPRQAPVLLCILIIVAGLLLGNIKIGYPRFGTVQKKLDALNRVSREFLNSVRVVKAFRAEDTEEEKFQDASSDLADANISALHAMAVFSPLINLTVNFGIVLLLWISRDTDASEIGKLMASVNYMTQVLFSVTMISNIINTAVRAIASSSRIQEVLDEKPALLNPKTPVNTSIQGDVRFENVVFCYPGTDMPAINNISFHIQPGETLGIIGPTGSGKTTLINLIPRFYDATRGSVLVDGIDVKQLDEKELRTSIAVVSQKALLFTGTVKENLLWGRDTATDAELQEAAETACADSFVQNLPGGYDAPLEQGGVNLSGGQKQRLSLARALVRKPRILILDDCTSALDAQTEANVLRGLRSLSGQMTLLLISQRVSTVMKADKILCLENGSVQGFGTHEELLKNCRTYQEIYASQIGGAFNG